jgi:hypothetical protein
MPVSVSHAGRFLDGVQARDGLSDYALSTRLGIAPRILARLKYEAGAGVSDKTLAIIVERVSENPDEQARFLVSYLKDRLSGPKEVIEKIQITVSESAMLQENTPSEYLSLAIAVAHKAAHDATALAVITALAKA